MEARSEKAILQRRNPNVLLYGCVCLSDRRLPNLLNATVADEPHSPLVDSTMGVKESCWTSMILVPCALLIHNFCSISSMLYTKPQHGTWLQSIKYPSYIDDNNANLRAYWRLCGKTDTKHLVNIIFVDVNTRQQISFRHCAKPELVPCETSDTWPICSRSFLGQSCTTCTMWKTLYTCLLLLALSGEMI